MNYCLCYETHGLIDCVWCTLVTVRDRAYDVCKTIHPTNYDTAMYADLVRFYKSAQQELDTYERQRRAAAVLADEAVEEEKRRQAQEDLEVEAWIVDSTGS